MAALKRAQIQGCPVVAARTPAPTALDWPLTGARTYPAHSGPTNHKVVCKLYAPHCLLGF